MDKAVLAKQNKVELERGSLTEKKKWGVEGTCCRNIDANALNLLD